MIKQPMKLIRSFTIPLLLILPLITLILPVSAFDDTLKAGPTVDRIQYSIITQDDQRILALEDDEIDIIGDRASETILNLPFSSEFEISEYLRNGYGYITINCNKYPLNETAFRRAFAFALDKERISDEIWDGLAIPQDSCIPQVNHWSSEGLLDFNYYTSDIERGNATLDQAGFLDIDGDSYREAPDGSDFHIFFECVTSSDNAVSTGEIAVDTLHALGINATFDPPHFHDYLNRLYFHGDYDMMFLGSSFSSFDARWLAYEFWSEYADEPYWNFPNWQNSTFDSWRNQFLHAITYEDVYEAALEMQRIWVQDCPLVICYENYYLTAHRTGHFSGFVNSVVQGFPGWWTNHKVRLRQSLGGPLGGTLRYSLSRDISTWNIIKAHQESWSTQGRTNLLVLNELYDSLFVQAQNGTILPWLVESFSITTHDDNPSIAENVTRFTLELVDSFTWSDGSPLTAEEISFTLQYYQTASGNPFEDNLAELRGAYTPEPGTLVVEFNGESYWYLYDFAYLPILPRMITEETDPADWEDWDLLQFGDEMITSGPFNLTSYEEGESIELTRNPNYYFAKNLTIDTTTSSTNPIPPEFFNPFQFIADNITAFTFVLGSSVGVIIVCHFLRKEPD